ncbi:MAG: hypothetical protein CL508_05230 [Actinobacteria bacterium]|nr:hypothetical protein [Actinomycetota bacterium]MBO71700.1 hypothetical protein [Actinomycetota bacterium]
MAKNIMFIHCKNCIRTMPSGVTTKERLEVAFSSDGEIIIRCTRCDSDVTTQRLAVPMEGSCNHDHV